MYVLHGDGVIVGAMGAQLLQGEIQMAQRWKKEIRIALRKVGHQPKPIIRDGKGSSYHTGGCRRCALVVEANTDADHEYDRNDRKLLTTARYSANTFTRATT